MYKYHIGNVARNLYAKLSSNLAGPLEKFLPDSWIMEALKAENHPFRNRVFSPLGPDMGLDRAGPRSG